MSLTFDDSNADQSNAVQIMNSLGLKGTFYVVSGYVNAPNYLTLPQLTSMASSGHEIGGHSVSHPDLTTVSPAEAKRQVCNDRATLLDWGFAVTSFAYPFASTNDSVETIAEDCGYNSARMLGDIASRFGCADCDNAESIPPSDPYYTKALDQVDSSWTLDDLTSAVTRAEKAGGGWLQFTFHHVCDNCDSLAVSPSLFGQFAQWLVDRSATHNTVVRTVGDVIGGPVKPAVVASLPPAPGPGVNGIINPSLESVDSNGVPSCWQTGGYGQNSPAFHTVSPGRTGAVAEQLTMAGYVDGDAKLLPTLDQGECAPTVTPGHTYSLRGWYQSTVPTQFEVYLRNAQGDWIYWTASPWLGASTTWAAGEWTTPEIPAGTTGLSFGLNLFQNGTLVTDDYALYDTVGAPTAPDAPPQVAAPLAPPPTAAIGVPDPAQSLGHTENETPDAHAPATGEQPANGQAEPTAPPAPEAPAAPEQPAPSSPAPSSTPPEEPATPEPAPSAPTPTEPPAQQPPAVAPQVSDPATAPPATS